MALQDLGLFALLAAFTLSTLDGGDIAPYLLSAATLILGALDLLAARHVRWPLPVCCLLAMTAYGVVQTLWFPHKIVYDGWTAVMFWLTAAIITLLASHFFLLSERAARFRFAFACFGSAVCVLDLLEQATRTNKYFWLIQSKFSTINGTFAAWNNFAQFVELLLPVTLWLGLKDRRPSVSFLVLAGLQIAAVVASGSRAGSALVLCELLLVLGLLSWRKRDRAFLLAGSSVVALSLLFILAAGSEKLAFKLEQKDQLSVRRQINQSSVEMIRQHPLAGWGLNSYVSVYRMFARYDDGTYVNRAHNDWLQWTAEGGVFFAALMGVVFLWSVRPALESVWGIGVLALCLHALVDYPFARLGVCGWYFALLGMLAATPSRTRRVLV